MLIHSLFQQMHSVVVWLLVLSSYEPTHRINKGDIGIWTTFDKNLDRKIEVNLTTAMHLFTYILWWK